MVLVERSLLREDTVPLPEVAHVFSNVGIFIQQGGKAVHEWFSTLDRKVWRNVVLFLAVGAFALSACGGPTVTPTPTSECMTRQELQLTAASSLATAYVIDKDQAVRIAMDMTLTPPPEGCVKRFQPNTPGPPAPTRTPIPSPLATVGFTPGAVETMDALVGTALAATPQQ